MGEADFQVPEFYSFPPFFTLQPVLATREKQLKLWCDMVLAYHKARKAYAFAWRDWPLWENRAINRRLDEAGAQAVVAELVRTGHAEWQDSGKTSLSLFWDTPADTAARLYEWARSTGLVGSVVTVYELHQGEDTRETQFHGMEEGVLRKAIAVLEADGRAVLFQGATSTEDGFKFF
ncbi:ESCRT-II complex subunit-domain-containing protein [Tribonema minus]|uniref:ESCRT-II complex subunit VPS25 n=1 Tax=Tribonema minus TaxID=303371 RepID=A0A835YLA2_9STRA|nr:ESCRT-II complex subunit-domain-containing protein [Tribonema minus]